ncbi:PREDICTED: hepatitis A virus cellular receptor 2 [Condylura cristata]|uniref:hepatitis A virus cellular receptor 2 n=1 Tax=Condylura cristata TaxID=143302 RepID=UPI000334319D|nr:PREDICTED: hepatitis A virus cellular receptor 2 [Condylura cristata]
MCSHLTRECGLLLLLLFTTSNLEITVEEGKDAFLPCFYSPKEESNVPVCWGRKSCPWLKCQDLVLSTDGTKVTYQISSRHQLEMDFQSGNVSLTIKNVTWADRGPYCCRIQYTGLMNDKKVSLNLVIKPAKVAPTPTPTLLGTLTSGGYDSETPTQVKVGENRTVTGSPSLSTEVSSTESKLGVICGAGVSAGLLLVLIFGVLIFGCYSHRKEKLQNSSLLASATIAPSGLANMAAQGCHSEENIYVIEENMYEMEDPYAHYCTIIPGQPS